MLLPLPKNPPGDGIEAPLTTSMHGLMKRKIPMEFLSRSIPDGHTV
jgi:hypothetical protein